MSVSRQRQSVVAIDTRRTNLSVLYTRACRKYEAFEEYEAF